nr:retrotransposon protein, putative, unclassified [Tanacetum cinerariifolium]
MYIYALSVNIMEPKSVKEAMTDPEWIDSKQEELLQFKWLDVWELVALPDNIKTPYSKMVIQKQGFIDADHPSHVYKLKKALYGLKQTPKACRFEMSMIREMTFFLGLQVNQSPRGIFINQSNYVLEILKKYVMETCDPISTPMEIKDKLDLDKNGTRVDATKYQSMIGALMYLTSSIPDIIHATCLCAWYQAQPTEKHLKEIPIYCDSKSAIAISCDPVQHSRTKHIAVHYHFIKEHVEKGTIELYFVKTDYKLADIFTKAIPVDQFNYLVCCLSMRNLWSPQELERLAKSQ